jgi:hypothetical protein
MIVKKYNDVFLCVNSKTRLLLPTRLLVSKRGGACWWWRDEGQARLRSIIVTKMEPNVGPEEEYDVLQKGSKHCANVE